MSDRDIEAKVVSKNPFELPNTFVVERTMSSSTGAIYDAWVRHFDAWFASPDEIVMEAVVGRPFWFATSHEGAQHSHYGRFLRLDEGRLVELTWVSGAKGTDGAETIVKVELEETASGTQLRLTHGGFYDESAASRHREAWPLVLEHLDATLTTKA